MTAPDAPEATQAAADHRGPSPRCRSRVWRWAGLLALLALGGGVAVVLGGGFGQDPTVVPSALINRPAPPLAGPTLDGGRLDLRDYRGQVVLVNVWASWCAACEREHPTLDAAQRQLGPHGLQVVGVDINDTKANARRFLAEMSGAAYPSVFDPNARIAVDWGAFGVPETYLVNRDGIIVKKALGPVTPQWIQTNVVPLLGQ